MKYFKSYSTFFKLSYRSMSLLENLKFLRINSSYGNNLIFFKVISLNELAIYHFRSSNLNQLTPVPIIYRSYSFMRQ